MEKILKLYTYIDGINDSEFPNSENQIEIYDFTYDVKRMGGAPTISATVMYQTCLDDVWVDQVYAEFNGEKYFLKQTPTSSFSNKDARYKHEVELVSERIILDNVYFYDVVSDDVDDYKPVTNSSKVQFFGNVVEFASRLNYSLEKSGLDYSVVVDNGVESEDKLISFENQFFSNVLQEVYNTYELPYYFVGKIIHIGYTDNTLTEVFEYGIDNSLLSITKTNKNNKIVNRITGTGSSDNIPYYYPNETEKGGISAIVINGGGLQQNDVVVQNQELYAKGVDMTVDKSEILESSKVSYFIGDGNFNSFSVSLDGKNWNNIGTSAGDFEFTWFMINYHPIDVFLKYSIYVTSNGILRLKPFLSYNDVVKENNQEVIGYYSTSDDMENSVAIFALDDEFAFPVKANKSYYVVFQYTIYYSGTQTYKFLVNGSDRSFVGGWFCNGKQVSLSDIGIAISDNASLKNGDAFYQLRTSEYIAKQTSLMPSIYRETFGNERFYNALNDTYKDKNGNYYVFGNPYVDGKPKEHIETFDEIKPTIKETMVGSYRIDMFSEFAYDANDNDETEEDENGNLVYKHPYFFGKLRKLDFNLFDCAIESGEMTISMTSGHCGACKFVIGVDSENQKNKVQVDENGNLLRDTFGDVRCERKGKQGEIAQDIQNDTINNEVWIALKKDIDTFGTIMPNNVSKPKADDDDKNDGDTFVILNILLPKSYIINAEKRLDEALIEYMSLNNDELFDFSIDFSRIYLAENERVLNSLNENARLTIRYNGRDKQLYVSSYSYKMSAKDALPEIKVELTEELSVAQNAIQSAISGLKTEILSSIGSVDWLKIGLSYFVRKDIDDYVNGVLRYSKGLEVGKYLSGALGTGGSFKVDDKGNTHIEADYLSIRKKATFTEITIQELNHIGGQLILSPAAMRCTSVEKKDGDYYCYFKNTDENGTEILNEFIVGDLARSQSFNIVDGNRYYWRLVTEVGLNYIVLSGTKCDEGSVEPKAGDVIVQLGNESEVARQNAQILSSYGEGSPYFTQYVGINDFSLDGKEQTRISPNNNLFTGRVNIQPNSTGLGNFEDLPEEIHKAVQIGGDNILRNSSFTGDYESEDMSAETALDNDANVYSENTMYWSGDFKVIDEGKSMSGKAVELKLLRQSVSLIENENYVVSFYAKGSDLTFYCCSFGKNVECTSEYQKFVFTFVADTTDSVFHFIGNATIYDVKLERGTIATDWTPSILDNDKVADEFKHLQYLAQAMKDGNTDIIGGLILSSLLQVGKYKDNVLESVTAGVNGGWYDDESVAFWAGGTLEQAIKTVSKFVGGEIPTDDDWLDMAKFVATHGGDVFMRGYLNALGISLRGKIESVVGENKFVIDPDGQRIYAKRDEIDALVIDYANSRISLNGEDCQSGMSCVFRDVYLSAAGLEFKTGDKSSSYGALGCNVETANFTTGTIETANITTANIKTANIETANITNAENPVFTLNILDANGDITANTLKGRLVIDADGYLKLISVN